MKKTWIWAVLFLILASSPVFATTSGDKIIPQIADGIGGDGTIIRTKIAVYNLSGTETLDGFYLKLRFFHEDGSPWVLSTSLGTANEFPVDLAPRQTLSVRTLGLSIPMTSGYARVVNSDIRNSFISTNYAFGLNVFYEVLTQNGVVDTVSVPVYSPTSLGSFPIEINSAVSTGFAVVNCNNGAVQVQMDLYGKDGKLIQSALFALEQLVHRSEFLEQNLFPGLHLDGDRGLVEFKTTGGPVAILALRQFQTAGNGVQYSTLDISDNETLSRDTLAMIGGGYYGKAAFYPIDLDTGSVVTDLRCGGINDGSNYCSGSSGLIPGEDASWDILVKLDSTTQRSFAPYNGAMAKVGYKSSLDYYGISLYDLKQLSYSKDPIDMSDGADTFKMGYVFGVRTSQGNYAKIFLRSVSMGGFTCYVKVYK
jgi:hypothetical protein